MVTRVSIPTSHHSTLLSPLSSIGFIGYILSDKYSEFPWRLTAMIPQRGPVQVKLRRMSIKCNVASPTWGMRSASQCATAEQGH